MRRRSAAAAAVLAAVLAAGAAVPPAPAPGPRGPLFGNNACEGEIRDDGEPDADDFVGPLLEGERLSVTVDAAPGSALRPVLALLDPAGADRTPPPGEGGARAAVRSFAADLSGRWTVRVRGAAGTEGGYAARFRVRTPRAALRRTLVAAAGAGEASVPFPGVRGARLSLRVAGAGEGEGPPALAVLDPSGAPHPLAGNLLGRRGSSWGIDDLPLDRGDGTWNLAVAPGERTLRVALRVSLDGRPRGRTVLGSVEPRLEPRDVPHEAIPGGILRVIGTGFSRSGAPSAWIGGRPAEVLGVGPAGDRLDLRVPPGPAGDLLEVAVANPDGQATAVPGYLRTVPPGPPVPREFLPAEVRLPAGASVEVRLLLSGHAPAEGLDVPLAVEGGVGAAPAFARAAPHAAEAPFTFVAGPAEGTGFLRAGAAGTVVVPVVVTAPPPPRFLDLSGWRLRQTSATKTWVLPEGTAVARGGSLVVARKSDRASFESFWGGALPAGTAFLDSGDRFPSLNGDETLALEDPDGAVVDGPTVPLVAGRFYERVPGADPSLPSSWIDGTAAPGAVIPGGPPPAGSPPPGPFLLRFADPPATGQFVHEFLEIRWE